MKAHTTRWPFTRFIAELFDEYPHLAANAIFVSTGGTPTDGQMKGLLAATPKAHHFLCFDNDKAGREFCANFHKLAQA